MYYTVPLLVKLVAVFAFINASEAQNTTKRYKGIENSDFEPVTVKSISCVADPKYVRNVKCFLQSTNRTHKKIVVSLYVINEENNILLRIKHTTKTKNNIYTPGFFDVTLKVCEFVKNLQNDVPSLQKNLLDKFAPNWQTLYGHLLHPCPYQGLLTLNQSVTGAPKNWKFPDLSQGFSRLPTKWESKT